MDTYVVRVFRLDEQGSEALRGVVSQVASGRSENFTTADELVAFLVDSTGGQGIDEEPQP